MRVAFTIALLCCAPARAEDVHCPKGMRTTLTIEKHERPEILRPDEAIGGDVLRMRAGKRELMHAVSHDFYWMCLAYSKQRGYLVGSQAALDDGIVLRTIGYLAEDSEVLEASAFTRERYHAYAALPSRDGRWIAFIGGRDDLALYVLDTKLDEVRKLGPAPSAPGCADWSCITSYTAFDRWRIEGGRLVVIDLKGKRRIARRYKL